jgi:glycosyltransferase involved in cell wall biosynthesis
MEYRPYYIGQSLIRKGHQLTILASSFSHLRRKNPVSKKRIFKENVAGIDYIWVNTPHYKNNLGRIINHFYFILQLYIYESQIFSLVKPDFILASSTYMLDAPFARRMANKYSIKVAYEVKDLWPLTLIELGKMSKHNPYISFLQVAENYMYNNMDAIITTLPDAKEYMAKHGVTSDRYFYIPNGVWGDDWNGVSEDLPDEHQALLTNLRRDKKFIIGYFGSHGVSNALEMLINSAELLVNTNICIILVGQGSEKQNLQKMVRERNIQNVYFLPLISRTQIPTLLNNVDACYLGWNKIDIYRYGISPNKLLDYMMAAKPIIHALPIGRDPVAEIGCGLSISTNNAEDIAQAMIQLSRLQEAERIHMGENGRRYVLANHDYNILSTKLLDTIRSLNEKK